jgi:hypothetical protein
MFTARYGLIPYIKQITFSLQKVNWDGQPSGYVENPDNWIFL